MSKLMIINEKNVEYKKSCDGYIVSYGLHHYGVVESKIVDFVKLLDDDGNWHYYEKIVINDCIECYNHGKLVRTYN